MASYVYAMPAANQADLTGLIQQCTDAGLPVQTVQGNPSLDQIVVITSRELTPAEVTTLDGIVAGYDGRARRPRLIYDVWHDVGALTAAQKVATWNDLQTGDPPRWALDRGPNAADLHTLWLFATQVGAIQTATDRQKCQQMLISIYTVDNPTFLCNPPFDPTIEIPGDEPVP